MKKIIFLLGIFFFYNFNAGATNYTDSLRAIIHTYEKSKITNFDLITQYYILAEQLNYSNPVEAKQLLDKALKGAKHLNDNVLISSVYYEYGRYYLAKQLYSRALDEYFKAYQYLINNDELERTGFILIDIGNIYYKIGNYNVAVELYKRARTFFERNGNKVGLAVSINNMGLVFNARMQYDSAEAYFYNVVDIRKAAFHGNIEMALSYYYLAITNKLKGNVPKALNYIDLCLTKMRGTDTTISYNQEMFAKAYEVLAELHSINRNYGEAIIAFDAAISNWRLLYNLAAVASVENNKSKFFYDIKDYKSALISIEIAYIDALKGNDLQQQARSCYLKSLIYIALNKNVEAMQYFRKYENLQESVVKQINSRAFSETQVAMETVVKEKEKDFLRKNSRTWKYIYIGIISVLLCIITLSILLYQNKKRQERRFRQLSNSTFEGILIHDGSKILNCNEKLLKLLGVSNLVSLKDFTSKIVNNQNVDLIKHKTKSSEVEEFEIELIDSRGRPFPVEVHSKMFDSHRGLKILAVRELSAKKQAEFALRESQRRMETLLKNLPGMAYVCRNDKNWTMDFVSDGCFDLTGYKPEELIGNNKISFNELIVPDYQENIWNTWQDVLAKGESFESEFPIIKADGTIIWVWERGCGVIDENGHLVSLEGFIIDITAQRVAIEEIRQSTIELKEANITKDKFFSIIAHDLKGPLHVIMGFSELLHHGYNDYQEADKKRYIKNVYEVSGQLSKLLQNLLEWSRSRTGRIEFLPELINLSLLMNNIQALFADQVTMKNIFISVNVQHQIWVFCDENMIKTILRNLISNAIKFNFQDGKIQIDAVEFDGMIQISVADNGLGIPADDIKKVFQIEEVYKREGTAHEKGTGLGLILCKEFVERHRGKIWVESVEGQGSTFFFTIPNSKNA